MNVAFQPKGTYTISDIDLIAQYQARQAQENFWAFRQYMDPKLRIGWWPKQVSYELQDFYTRLVNGHRPKMMLFAPPQHGKSRGMQDFVSWVSGRNNSLRTIFASFSGDLGVKTNGVIQKVMDDAKYRSAFPLTQLSPLTGGGGSTGRYVRNSTLLEFIDASGSFRNTTVEGQINGQSLDLGIIDDPLKGRNEAQSAQNRDKVWAWLMDDFFARFDDAAGMLMIMTRWHLDDPAGRWMAHFPNTKVLRYPAEGTARSIRDNYEPRRIGDVLFPEFKSKEFILERKSTYTSASWESLYQQDPIIAGGGMFPIAQFKIIGSFSRKDIKRSVRYWDKAGTKDGGAYTAGCLMHLMKDGEFVIEDIVRGQWDAWTREQRILQTAQLDGANGRTEIYVEQEPGSGGLESAERTISMLAGFIAAKDKVTGDKETRAEPYAAQQQGGRIHMLRKPWNRDFINEHESFPTGKYKDQVDAAAGAFAKLIEKKYRYDTSMNWV